MTQRCAYGLNGQVDPIGLNEQCPRAGGTKAVAQAVPGPELSRTGLPSQSSSHSGESTEAFVPPRPSGRGTKARNVSSRLP